MAKQPIKLNAYKQTAPLLEKDPRDKESQVLHIPLSKAEHKEFKAEAAARDLSMADYFRQLWRGSKGVGQ